MEERKEQSTSQNSNTSVDRISGLPKPILHHILSFLPTQEVVVQTCVLSKTWRNIWCSVPTLKFLNSRPDFVDAVLFQRHSSNIQKLDFHFALQAPDISRLNNWIMYAIRHNVQHLFIYCLEDQKMELPCRIFTCESLRELQLIVCTIFFDQISTPWRHICFDQISLLALKTLKLVGVSFKNCHVEKLLFSAIPSLETLVIRNCKFQSHELTLSLPQLKNLDFYRSPLSILVISAPNLISLKLGGAYSKPFIVALQYDLAVLACLQTPFCNMKWLKMGTSFSDADILVINTFLKHSPHIETIILENQMKASDHETTTGQSFEVEKIWCVYKLSHLKQVEIKGFKASENEMKLVKSFLENAPILEELVILTSKSEKDYQDMIKTGRKLLSYPRASTSVGILFA